ncbi:pyrroline-5-carboxylate reductase [Mucisphaera sp.]|uniref:pyrroline-5-carboxylate reductase n=1 Tax=Mucisphaera sp. TaxID=2913024 RepID=UPI003D11C8F2
MPSHRIGFIGAGNMAEAIARSAIAANLLKPDQIAAADPSPERLAVFASFGIATYTTNADLLANCEQIILAIKPQVLEKIAADLQPLRDDQILISIMAGMSTTKIAATLGRPARIVRVMPNTPVMIARGMAGICIGSAAEPGDEDLSVALFEAGGEVVRVDEEHMDAITAVSGSGPAYLFYLAEAMTAAAAEIGLGEHADKLVRQTLLGAAELLAQSEEPPAELRRRVTSPGGTTAAAIDTLDQEQTTKAVIKAITAARDRGRELGA